MGTAFGAVLTFITSPIGLVVIAIGALVAAGVLLYKNWETIKEKAVLVWDNVTNFMSNTITAIVNVFKSAFNWIDQKTNGTFSKVVNIIIQYMTLAWNNIKAVWDFVKNTFKNALAFVKALVTGDFGAMKNAIQNQMQNVRNLISNILGNIKTFFANILGGILSNVRARFNSIKESMSNPVETAKDKIKNAIDKIKNFFSNLKLKIPKIERPKLPKFSLKGSFSLNPPSVPKIGIEWYKHGGIMTNPTVFGINGNNLMVGGEAGAEAILPLTTSVLSDIGKGISATMRHSNQEELALLKEQNNLLRQLLNKDTNILLDGKIISKSVSNRQADDYNIHNYIRGNR